MDEFLKRLKARMEIDDKNARTFACPKCRDSGFEELIANGVRYTRTCSCRVPEETPPRRFVMGVDND